MKCQVEGCTGEYQHTILKYINIRNRKTTGIEYLSTEDYENLENKKGCHAIVDNICNICSDSLDSRLVSFIQNELNPSLFRNLNNGKTD